MFPSLRFNTTPSSEDDGGSSIIPSSPRKGRTVLLTLLLGLSSLLCSTVFVGGFLDLSLSESLWRIEEATNKTDKIPLFPERNGEKDHHGDDHNNKTAERAPHDTTAGNQNSTTSTIFNSSKSLSYQALPSFPDGEYPDDHIMKEDDKRKGLELLHHFKQLGQRDATMSLDLLPLLPKPRGDDVTIHNILAWRRANELIFSSKNNSSGSGGENDGTAIGLTLLGGSITAGWGVTGPEFAYDGVFVSMLEEAIVTKNKNISHPQQIIITHNRAHGDTTTYRSAYSLLSFVPEKTDILIWEHSPNDDADNKGDKWSCQTPNNGLVLFLNRVREVAAMSNRAPPWVILVYFWDGAIWLPRVVRRQQSLGQNNIPGRIFKCHNHLAASYDFVVGSVNVGSYLNRLQWKYTDMAKWFRPQGDKVHPNNRGHWIAAFLLRDLLLLADSKKRAIPQVTPPDATLNSAKAPMSINITCDLTKYPPASQKLADILVNKPLLASWTSALPRNEEHRKGMIYPLRYHANNFTGDTNLTIVNLGKIKGFRRDRRMAMILPCCSSGESVGFELYSAANTSDSSLSISALQLSHPKSDFPLPSEGVRVHLLDSSGRTIWNTKATETTGGAAAARSSNVGPEWSALPGKCGVDSWYWLILPTETTVSRIDFCTPSCDDDDSPQAAIMDLILY